VDGGNSFGHSEEVLKLFILTFDLALRVSILELVNSVAQERGHFFFLGRDCLFCAGNYRSTITYHTISVQQYTPQAVAGPVSFFNLFSLFTNSCIFYHCNTMYSKSIYINIIHIHTIVSTIVSLPP
jgi:hypothetical protein